MDGSKAFLNLPSHPPPPLPNHDSTSPHYMTVTQQRKEGRKERRKHKEALCCSLLGKQRPDFESSFPSSPLPFLFNQGCAVLHQDVVACSVSAEAGATISHFLRMRIGCWLKEEKEEEEEDRRRTRVLLHSSFE